MKPFPLLSTCAGLVALALVSPFTALPAETSLDTGTPTLVNPHPQYTGVSLTLSDVMRNADDDQNKQSHFDNQSSQHEVLDIEHNPSDEDEDDLKLCVVTGTAGPTGGTLTLQEIDGQAKYGYTLWKDGNKREVFTERGWSVPPNTTHREVFFIEGQEISHQKNDIVMKATMSCPGGWADLTYYLPAHASVMEYATVWEADLDIDADNKWGIDEPEDWGLDTPDDRIEHSLTDARPGKIMITTMGKDTDEDGTPDFADGLGLPGITGGGTSGGVGPGGETTARLVPIRVHLREPIEPEHAIVRFDYPASIPRLGTDQGDIVIQGSGTADSPRMYFLKQSALRIWAWDAPHRPDSLETGKDITPGSPERKFVPDGEEIPWPDLCAAVEGSPLPPGGLPRELILYLEYAEAPPPPQQTGPSTITGGLPVARPSGVPDMRKSITFTETAQSGGLATDLVHVTLTFIDLDVNGNLSLTDSCDGLRNYLPGYEGPDPKIHDTAMTSFETAAYQQAQGADCGGMKLLLMGVGSDIVDKAEFKIIRGTSVATWNTPTASFCVNAEKNGASTGAIDISFNATTDLNIADGQIGSRMTYVPIYCKDYGAWAEIEIKLSKAGQPVAQPILVRLPFDYNGDRLADLWQYGQIIVWNQRYPGHSVPTDASGLSHFAPESDLEMADSDGMVPNPYPPMADDGDGLTVHEEYRGYIFDGGPGTTPGDHKRLSAALKELLVECSEMDGIASTVGSLPPDPASGFTDQGNNANPAAQGYTLASTMQAVSGFFGVEGAPIGTPRHFPGAILDTYWVRDKLNDIGANIVYQNGTVRGAYKYSGPYQGPQSGQQGDGWLSIAYDHALRLSDEVQCTKLYGSNAQGVAILANLGLDNRNRLCRQFVKLAIQGRRGSYLQSGAAYADSAKFAVEVDETQDSDYRRQGASIFVNSISEESSPLVFPDRLPWAFSHETGHLFIDGRNSAPFDGGEHIITGTDNLMNGPPSSFSNCRFHYNEITNTNLRQRASVNHANNGQP